MYKIAVFSDIYGNLEALQAILEDINKNDFDEIICLGDVINLGPNSKECLNLIVNSNIKWILGNHDLYFIHGLSGFEIEEEKKSHYRWVASQLDNKDREAIKDNPLVYYLNKDGFSFKFQHYFIKDDKALYPFYSIGTIKKLSRNERINLVDADYTIYGHDHEPNSYNLDGKYLCDVGSSGCLKDDKTFYTIIEINKEVKIVRKYIPYNRKQFEEKIKKAKYPMISHIASGFYGINI